ncbi:MAG: 2-C-methyl-D-erythritol 4-phosphate cytidylyltransferase [Prochloraceae cyanobacterium]|nr:2-C-methyl-D-erythritol 4-phosphate cytidylyltransferase [Prochloraceae cyanobacterium]
MHLLIPAAGVGKRMGGSRNKLLLTLLERPILAWTLIAANAAAKIDYIGIIGQEVDFPDFKAILPDLELKIPVEFILGGSTRQESVYNGLQALPKSAGRVLIHDGARCLATPELFDRCAEQLNDFQGLIAAVPVKDTIKVVDETGAIQSTPDRSRLWAAQTPQGFDVDLLKSCHDRGVKSGWSVTDDAALFEKCDLPVQIVNGEETNIKLTTPIDLAIAEFILQKRQSN